MLSALAVVLLQAATFHTNFEGGSLGRVERRGESYRLHLRGDVDQEGRNRQANWYSFRVEDAGASEIILDLVDLPGEYNYRPNRGAVTGDTPPVISYNGRDWRHVEHFEYDANEPRLRLRVVPLAPRFWIAHTPPYTNENLDRLRAAIPSGSEERIGVTPEGRPLVLWTLGSGPKTVWLMVRQHAWESGTSWVAEGLVRRLSGADAHAERLRREVTWKILPLCDPDGVARGRVRFNAKGFDLNRNWDVRDPGTMPEIAAQYGAIQAWIRSGNKIDLFLTLHNTETGEFLEGPPAGAVLDQLLARHTSFDPSQPLRPIAPIAGKGRASVYQQLHAEFGINAILMEQRVAMSTKLGRRPLVEDRLAFGRELLNALWAAVTGSPYPESEVEFPAGRIQKAYDEYTAKLEAYLDREIAAAPERRRHYWKLDTSSLAAYEKSAAPYRRRFLTFLGNVDRYPRGPVTNIRLERIADRPTHTVERAAIEVMPGVDASGILLVPKSGPARKPAVFFQHGMAGAPESPAGLLGSDDLYHSIAQRMAEQGFVVWSNRMTNTVDLKARLDRKARMVGQRLQGLEQYIVLRVIDYLASRPDTGKIGMYGISWGGRTTLYGCAIDPRLAACVINGHRRAHRAASCLYRERTARPRRLDTHGQAGVGEVAADLPASGDRRPHRV